MSRRIRILHVINNLATGGAESMLVRLALALRDEFEQSVVCILDRGPLASRLEDAGIPVTALGVSARLPNPAVTLRLARHIRAARPDVVQTWLYQSDLLGGVAARLAGTRNLVWNLRGADLSPSESHRLTRVVVRVCAAVSYGLPRRIVCCAESVRAEHVRIGYDPARMILIHNGVDIDAFKADEQARDAVRRELRLPSETPLIGLIARWHPQKDHQTFFAAVAFLRQIRPDVHFLLAGKGVHGEEPDVTALLRAHALSDHVHLLGERHDIPRLTAALDVASSSSAWGEGFPNVIAEAMACAVPCAATDAGDARLIVGDTGKIVPRRDSAALAAAWAEMLSLDTPALRLLGSRARERIVLGFSLRQSTERYADLYRNLAGAD
jgi:glycosyltransferase involved in cell wall biosynthesis